MINIQYSSAVEALSDKIDSIRPAFLAVRTTLLQKFGENLLSMVRGRIGTNLHDANGHVASWQTLSIKKGYVAVRPRKEAVSGDNSVGAITNYLEGGHAIRKPSGSLKSRYRPRVRIGKVAGRKFYANACGDAEAAEGLMAAELENLIKEQIVK